MSATSLERNREAIPTRNNRTDAPPLRYDTPYQARVHSGHHADRRRVISALLSASKISGPADDLDDADPHYRIARKIAHCCRAATILNDASTGQIMLSQARCRSRLCPRCAKIRQYEMAAKIRQLVREIDDARFLTLTLASSDAPLADQIARLKDCFKRLRRRRAGKAHITGGVMVLEITYNHSRKQWHPHLHCIVDGTYWPQAEIADAWEKITGDSRIVDIRRVGSRDALTRYVVKYVSKTSCSQKIPHHKIAEWATEVHGSRMFQAFGHLHAIAIEKPEKPDRDYENLASMAQMSRAAANGNQRAARLWRAVTMCCRHRISDDKPREAERHLTRHRSIAGRVRRWLRTFQDGENRANPQKSAKDPPANHPDNRAEWLWEKPTDPAGCTPYRH